MDEVDMAAANAAREPTPFFIGGKLHHPEKTFDVVSPKTGQVIHRCGNASLADVESAVQAADAAFPSWRLTPPAERRDIFLRAADVMQKRKPELMGYMMEETGGAEPWADFNVTLAIDIMKDLAGRAATIEGTFPPTKSPDVSCIVLREPFGVVLAIAPWNAPYILGTRAAVAPIAAGNTVVLKGTELAPKTMWAIASVLHDAGLPKGVINTISHEPGAGPTVTSALIKDRRVKKISFTGSTAVGREIGKLAGENLKPVLLELGGKAPAIVWEDADLQVAAVQCALGAFLNSGQICMSTERILVHESIRDDFIARLKQSVEEIFPSNKPAGFLISDAAVEKNKRLVSDAKSKGASILFGNMDSLEAGAAMRPTILGSVTPSMDIYHTESFGPTVSIIGIKTEEDAIQIANDTDFGLASAVFTADLRRGLRFARQIEAGAVHINSMSVHDEPTIPHGGAKASGFGRFNTSIGLAEWLWTKSVTFDN